MSGGRRAESVRRKRFRVSRLCQLDLNLLTKRSRKKMQSNSKFRSCNNKPNKTFATSKKSSTASKNQVWMLPKTK